MKNSKMEMKKVFFSESRINEKEYLSLSYLKIFKNEYSILAPDYSILFNLIVPE